MPAQRPSHGEAAAALERESLYHASRGLIDVISELAHLQIARMPGAVNLTNLSGPWTDLVSGLVADKQSKLSTLQSRYVEKSDIFRHMSFAAFTAMKTSIPIVRRQCGITNSRRFTPSRTPTAEQVASSVF